MVFRFAPTDPKPRSAGLAFRRACGLAFILALLAGFPAFAATPLAPLLSAPGSTVSLNAGTTYTIGEYGLTSSKTLLCNGATIQSTGGAMKAGAQGIVFTVDNCVVQGTGWGLLAALNGGSLVVRNNTRLAGNSANTAIYLASARLDLTGGSISQCRWGVNMENSTAALHAVSISSTPYAVQNVAGHVTVDRQSNLQNLNPSDQGTGVSVIASPSWPTRGAVAVVHDTTFSGFGNAVDIQPTAAQGLPAGTVEIVGATFNAPYVSAVSTVDAIDIHVVGSRVLGAKADGIYLQNTTGVVERTQILDSLNTGISFWACPNGATLRDSLVRGSAHQAVAVVSDPPSGQRSRNIRILDNTFDANTLADVLVEDQSDAFLQGNTLKGSDAASVHVRSAGDADLVGNFIFGAYAGHEVKESSTLTSALSLVARQRDVGALVYAGGQASFGHCALQSNGTQTGDYSMFVNTSGQLSLRYCTLDPPATPALYNNAGNAATATNNYWSHPAGPQLLSGGGSGAILGWNASNGSSVAYQPTLASSPVNTRINEIFALSQGATTHWASGIGIGLSLRGAAGIASVANGLAAALRISNAATLTAPAPPSGTLADGVLAAWAHHDLLSRAATGTLRVAAAGAVSETRLSRLRPDACWAPVSTMRDGGTGEFLYTPAYPGRINGVYALGNPPALEETRARQLITSFYTDILARAPETGAVDAWYGGYFADSVEMGLDVRFVPREMSRPFFASAEYAARGRSDEQFLRDAYQVFLRRAPTQAELNAWLAGSSTWNRAQAVVIFAESAEFAAYVRALFPCLDGSPSANFIATMYVGLIDKLVDPGGLWYFEDALDAAYATAGIEGTRADALDLAALLMASADYGQPGNQAHVERLYRAFLGRFPGNNEISYWKGALDAGTATPQTLVAALAASPEFTARLRAAFASA